MCTWCGRKVIRGAQTGRPLPGSCPRKEKTNLTHGELIENFNEWLLKEDELMGFWDIAKAVGTAARQGVERKMENIQRYMDEYERYDDERLLRLCRSASGDKQIAILKILKNRGYSASDIQNH